MTKKTRWIIGLFGAASVWGAGAEEAVRPTLPDTPFWLSQEMKHEPILFVQAEGAARASGRLLFVPDSPPVVYHSDGVTRYEAGRTDRGATTRCRSASRAASRCHASSRFIDWLRRSVAVTTTPLGWWVIRMPV